MDTIISVTTLFCIVFIIHILIVLLIQFVVINILVLLFLFLNWFILLLIEIIASPFRGKPGEALAKQLKSALCSAAVEIDQRWCLNYQY